MKYLSTTSISGIDIVNFNNIQEAVDSIVDDFGGVAYEFAIAINAEKIMSARRDPKVMDIIQSGTLRYADGIGAVLAMRKKGVSANRVPGCDLWENVMEKAGELGVPVYLVGGKPQVLALACTKLKEEYKVNLVGCCDGYFDDQNIVVQNIAQSGAKIVCVAMGSPKQEALIEQCRKSHHDAFYMGLGGTFDVFTGTVKRAPKMFQSLGLEWLYRLLSDPTRIRRQIVYIKFMILLVLNKL
ncbi:MAG: WecB/TagA/CpsF family glycosyltransferase [Gammaproteobacteria bacterium]|nr:WecB/TagA/CpsF family glycosyltransferase [Gammaproteobacteria bacterium]